MKRIDIDVMTQQNMKEAYLNGAGAPELAARFGYGVHIIYRSLRRMGLHPSQIAATRSLGAGSKWTLSGDEELELIKEYQQGQSLRNLAAKTCVAEKTIRKVLRRHNVPTRPRHSRPIQEELFRAVIADWRRHHTIPDLMAKFRVRRSKINRILTSIGVKIKPGHASGENHWNYRGGRAVTSSGYVRVLMARDHPFYNGMADNRSFVAEHRLVMAEHIGRALLPRESVHHKDGNRANNIPSNLELHQNLHGSGSSWVCADCGSHNIVAAKLH